MNDDLDVNNAVNSEGEDRDPRHNIGTHPNSIAKRFSSTNQPSNALKQLGWWKKKKGKKMLQALMQLKFEGDYVPEDPNDPNSIKINPIRKKAAEYFGMPEEFITVEMIMAMIQVAKAVQQNDGNAFNAVWEKAYGKTREEPLEDTAPPPAINFLPAGAEEETLEIKEDENDSSHDGDDGDSEPPESTEMP